MLSVSQSHLNISKKNYAKSNLLDINGNKKIMFPEYKSLSKFNNLPYKEVSFDDSNMYELHCDMTGFIYNKELLHPIHIYYLLTVFEHVSSENKLINECKISSYTCKLFEHDKKSFYLDLEQFEYKSDVFQQTISSITLQDNIEPLRRVELLSHPYQGCIIAVIL